MTAAALDRAELAVANAQRRAERIRVGMHSFIATRREIAAAYAERDWVTLAYDSFEAYVESEFSEARLRLSTEERREAVAEFRRAGMSTRAIGAALGISKDTAARDLATVSDETVPDRITGTDGREQPATRPTPQVAEPERKPLDNQTPEPVTAPTVPVAGSGSTFPEPERHLRPVLDEELVAKNDREANRLRLVSAGQRAARTLVTDISAQISTVVSAIDLGEKHLITEETIAKLRDAVDLLASRLEASK